MLFIKKIYFKFNKNKLEKAKMKFKKISIDKIQFIIEKQCNKLNVKYKVLMKDKNKIIIKAELKNKNVILKFHKSLAVTLSDYDKFMAIFLKEEGHRGYYITTGVFHHDIQSKNYLEIFKKRIDIIDGYNFLLNQKWIKSLSKNHFIYNNISFEKYLKL